MNRRILSIPFFALAIMACGSSDGSAFGNGSGQNGDGNGQNDPEGTFKDPFGVGGVFAACASTTGNAALTPANLVIMYDKSGSMGDTRDGFDPNQRWVPVGEGMKAFLSDPASASMSAALQFFPLGATDDSFSLEKNNQIVCDYPYGDYAGAGGIPLTSLTNPKKMLTALGVINPVGGTPTLPALQGAIHYAKSIAAEKVNDKTAVVLVTDGEPNLVVGNNGGVDVLGPGCPNNDIPHVAAEAKAAFDAAPSVATYVIGVGPALDSMNAIAAAGGTKSAFKVDVADPAKTTTIFREALESIRAASASCNFKMPAPPAGQTLDTKAVNIVYTGGDGKHLVLDYSTDCASGNGWRYDNPAAPSTITLCPSTCNVARADRAGQLKIAFGCATKGDLK
jgi:hypothetical protein